MSTVSVPTLTRQRPRSDSWLDGLLPAISANRDSALINASARSRARDSSRRGLGDNAARHIARQTATLRRLRVIAVIASQPILIFLSHSPVTLTEGGVR